MTSIPPPYAPDESKGLYPTVQGYPPQQQQQQPGVYTNPGTASVTYYPSGPPQQQPQQLVITQPAPVIVATQQQPHPSFVCHIIFSCCTFLCCFWPLGLIAFVLAVVACCKASYSPESARKYGTASVVFSVISIVVVVMLVIFVLLASFVFHLEFVQDWMDRFTGCHDIAGYCYQKRKIVLSEESCRRYKKWHYENDYCYYDIDI